MIGAVPLLGGCGFFIARAAWRYSTDCVISGHGAFINKLLEIFMMNAAGM